jgi:hypothetical protein
MSQKYKLDITDGKAPGLIGILTDENDLKLSWLLNQKLKISLSRDDDLTWLNRDFPNPLSFPAYSDTNSRFGIIRFIKNRTIEGLWIKGYKQVDYLFILISDPDDIDKQKLINSILEIPEIRGVYTLDPGHLKGWVG